MVAKVKYEKLFSDGKKRVALSVKETFFQIDSAPSYVRIDSHDGHPTEVYCSVMSGIWENGHVQHPAKQVIVLLLLSSLW